MITLLNVTNNNKDDILNHDLIRGGEGSHMSNRDIILINLNLTHSF